MSYCDVALLYNGQRHCGAGVVTLSGPSIVYRLEDAT